MNKTLLAAAAVVGAVGVLAAALGLEVPKPAWKHDVEQIAGMTIDNTIRILRGDARDLKRDIWQLEERVKTLQGRGIDASHDERILREKNDLLREIEEAIRDEKQRLKN